ncbi:MAG: mechanosensitive ion channel family protein [Bacteroidota bacterium]
MNPLLADTATDVTSYLPLISTFGFVVLVFLFNQWFLSRTKSIAKSRKILRQILAFCIVLVGAVVIIFAIPDTLMDKGEKEQAIGFLGAIFTAAIALSSTTLLGNIIAGLMSQSVDELKVGSFISVGDYFGCVERKGILYTAIEMEDSNLLVLPNLYIASNPVRIYSEENTFVSSTVSLGYDVSRKKVEELLKEAATSIDLTNPFVILKELGDFSIVYIVHGSLEKGHELVGKRSALNAAILDVFHDNKVEIVSPTFMNQRQTPEPMIPKKPRIRKGETEQETESAEDINKLMFNRAFANKDKQEKEELVKGLGDMIADLEKKLKTEENPYTKMILEAQLSRNQREKEALEEELKALNQEKETKE